MNKLQSIHEFLSNIQKMLTEKREEGEQELIITNHKPKNKQLITKLQLNLEHTKGQLYETNFILENFWDIVSKE